MRVVLTGAPSVQPFPFALLDREALAVEVCLSPKAGSWRTGLPPDLVVRIGREEWLTPGMLAPGQWVLDARTAWFERVAEDAARFAANGQVYLDCLPVSGVPSGVLGGPATVLTKAVHLAALLGPLWAVGEVGAAHVMYALLEAIQHRWVRQVEVWQANGPLTSPESWAAMMAAESGTLAFAEGICEQWLARHPEDVGFVSLMARETAQLGALWRQASVPLADAMSRPPGT